MGPDIAYSFYDLHFSDPAKAAAQGILLRYRFTDGEFGFASMSAWPHAGDETLAAKLEHLTRNPRLEPHWSWACLDAELRRKKHAALPSETQLPDSHWHLRNEDLLNPRRWAELIGRGHRCWKLKISPSFVETFPLRELAEFARSNGVKLRLDANGSYTSLSELETLFAMLGPVDVIDFFEDPSAKEELWVEIRQIWAVPLASDWIRPAYGEFDLSVYKPSRDADFDGQGEFVITTAFDHPLGLNYTAYRSVQ
ncbi:MAG: hypothetical protein ACRD5Z_22660, partial [Bryobacteraceae bacterium]